MKIIGYIIITVGFLAGSLASVISEEDVYWNYFIAAVVAGAVGVAVVHFGERKESRSEDKLASNIKSIEDSLGRIVENITQLNSEKESINTYDVRFKIDELFIDDLAIFVDARQSISHIFGLAAYADVMSSFAAGERYLNRVWSASSDGYIDEVNTYIEKSREQFSESLEKIRQLKTDQAVASPSLS